jgi:hypothetical protein
VSARNGAVTLDSNTITEDCDVVASVPESGTTLGMLGLAISILFVVSQRFFSMPKELVSAVA